MYVRALHGNLGHTRGVHFSPPKIDSLASVIAIDQFSITLVLVDYSSNSSIYININVISVNNRRYVSSNIIKRAMFLHNLVCSLGTGVNREVVRL